MWQIIFKLEYLFVKEGKINTLTLSELQGKSWSEIIGILLLAYSHSFRKMFSIGQKLSYVYVAHSFDEILIIFWFYLLHQRNTG